ncbi:iron chelate uptake ABC transporter family permease subunit [Nonomuraea terrae]|uniref:iron chelate uptake ABC transporter family permease subunit n=1 Tax=Nonomuraea terrae TaxID=2530383 RepID=UPI0037B83665
MSTATALRATRRRELRGLGLLSLVAVAVVAAFCLVGLVGNWEYALGIRTRKVATMVVAGVAVACSSVLFQTVTGNRILTPGIMGFDRLFVLIQTLIVYLFGALTLTTTDPRLLFAGQTAVMVISRWPSTAGSSAATDAICTCWCWPAWSSARFSAACPRWPSG